MLTCRTSDPGNLVQVVTLALMSNQNRYCMMHSGLAAFGYGSLGVSEFPCFLLPLSTVGPPWLACGLWPLCPCLPSTVGISVGLMSPRRT
jgi:hypothetical protein